VHLDEGNEGLRCMRDCEAWRGVLVSSTVNVCGGSIGADAKSRCCMINALYGCPISVMWMIGTVAQSSF
jgi:hypothetical protein